MPLGDALKDVAEAFDAVAAVISRDQRGEGQSRLVADYDAVQSSQSGASLKSGYAEDVLGQYFNKMRAGTVWFLSDHLNEGTQNRSEGLTAWQSHRGIQEIVVVALETAGLRNDYVEFHFARSVDESEKREIETMMPTLVRAWAGRKTGLVTSAQMDERLVRARAIAQDSRPKASEALLGMSNPARLSRAEFRVCLLLSRGLSVKAVTSELGLSESTIRSHLCSIYSKTETSGLAELLYRLLSVSADGIAVSGMRRA